jgi:pimeloyl-ACP methyl ester carboxylesterase
LNLGGFANPDVLVVRHQGTQLVVKDWGRRSAWIRALVAPWLARHEAAMLARADGIAGVPRLRARIDRHAFAMEYVEGRPLHRPSHGRALPPTFFAELESILEQLARRGLAYLDLRSSTNVLITPSGAPALVDLGSTFRLPLPRLWILRFERRALVKLRARFECQPGALPSVADPEDDASASLKVGGTRFCLREHGRFDDPIPVLFLPDAGFSARVFAPILACAAAQGRRAIGVDLPGFGGSRRNVRTLAPARVAEQLDSLIVALRVARVDLVGAGFGALVGCALAAGSPERVRRLIAIQADDTPARAAELALRRSVAASDPEALRARLLGALPTSLSKRLVATLAAELARVPARNLALAYRESPPAPTPLRVGTARRVDLSEAEASDPDRIWSELAQPESR